MTMTDTADARATAAQCIELAEAGSEMVRVTVNLPEAAAARSRDQAAHARRRLHGAAHRRLPLQRPPAADEVSRLRRGARQIPDQSRATSAPASAATSSSRRSARSPSITASRCASASTAARSIRSSSSRRCRRTPTAISARAPKRSSTSAWCCRRSSRRRSRSRSGFARIRSSSRARRRGRAI